MIRYGESCGCCGGNPEEVDGKYVTFESAQAEIDKRDEQIADLKALLFRAADELENNDHTVSNDINILVTEIEKALA